MRAPPEKESRPGKGGSPKIDPAAEIRTFDHDLSSGEWAQWAQYRRLRAIGIGLGAIADHTDDPTIRDLAETLIAAIRLECILINARVTIGRAA